MAFLKPKKIQEWLGEIKELGIKGFVKKHGWKLVVAVFMYYLIRDSILYILIPYLIINNIITCQ